MLLALDIGGSKIRAALFKDAPKHDPSSIREQMLKLAVIKVNNNYAQDLEVIRQLIVGWLSETVRGKPIGKLDSVVIAIAGALKTDGSGLQNSVNLKGWEQHDLKGDLQQICGCKVTLANDAYCAAFAEAQCIDTSKDFWYVNWGTGIGGCLVEQDTKCGTQIRPSEVGHMSISAEGRQCRCGQLDCWDAYISGYALNSGHRKPYAELTDRDWQKNVELFVSGLKNLYLAVPVDLIILNGGVIQHHRELMPLIIQKFSEAVKIVEPKVEIRLAHLGDLAGLAGAWSLASLATCFTRNI